MVKFFWDFVDNIRKVILTFTKPAGVTWLIIGFKTNFELSQNFWLLTAAIIGIKTWRKIEKTRASLHQ